jgi:hypothetical protein
MKGFLCDTEETGDQVHGKKIFRYDGISMNIVDIAGVEIGFQLPRCHSCGFDSLVFYDESLCFKW